jgi:hypothetical protein
MQVDLSSFLDFQIGLKGDLSEEEAFEFYLLLIEWTTKGIDFQVKYKDPLLVSQGDSNDQLMVSITKPEMFISAESGESLGEDKTSFGKETPSQVPDDVDAEEMEETTKA